MAASRPLVYWDACCFLSYLSGDPSRSVLRTLMEDAKAGGILLVTSAISIAEVAYLAPEGLGRPLDQAIEAKIESMCAGFKRSASWTRMLELADELATCCGTRWCTVGNEMPAMRFIWRRRNRPVRQPSIPMTRSGIAFHRSSGRMWSVPISCT